MSALCPGGSSGIIPNSTAGGESGLFFDLSYRAMRARTLSVVTGTAQPRKSGRSNLQIPKNALTLGRNIPQVLQGALVAAGLVIALTWVAMPFLVKIAHPWLHPKNAADAE
jgi:hypothetical protein